MSIARAPTKSTAKFAHLSAEASPQRDRRWSTGAPSLAEAGRRHTGHVALLGLWLEDEKAIGIGVDRDYDILKVVIERASGSTILEIDRLVSELLAIRSVMQSEGERVRNEITQYTGLSLTAVDTIRIVADTLGQLSPYTPTLPPRLD